MLTPLPPLTIANQEQGDRTIIASKENTLPNQADPVVTVSDSDADSVVFLRNECAPAIPPLLSTSERLQKFDHDGWNPETLAMHDDANSIGTDIEDDLGLRLIKSDNNNCFATSVLLALVALSGELGEKWPTADLVTEQAKPFFRIVEKIVKSVPDGGYKSGKDSQVTQLWQE